jgi:secreted trypsin-like serine protease
LTDRADQLQQLQMSSISNLLCQLMHIGTEAQGQVTNEKICLTAPNEAGVCGGDSGGPILWRGETVGIACWTVRPCGSHPSVYIRISNHIDWIQQYV